jgi:hypothetical protein
MTIPHIGQEVDRFDIRERLEKYGYTPDFLAAPEIEVLLDAALIEALSLMRDRGYMDRRYIFGSKGDGVIAIRDTHRPDRPEDVGD